MTRYTHTRRLQHRPSDTSPITIRVSYVDGNAVDSWVSHIPESGIEEMQAAIMTTTPSKVAIGMPETCTIEYIYNRIDNNMTARLVLEQVPEYRSSIQGLN